MRLKVLSGIEGRDYEVDVRVPSRTLTEQEFKEYNIRANKNTGEFDFDILSSAFEYGDLQDWGFSDDELTDFTVDLIDDDSDADDVAPDKPEKARSQLGDIYELGNHRVLCGDSTDKEIVAALMNGDKAELLHADPPYGMGKEKDGIINDNLYRDKLDAFQMEWWRAFRPHLEDNGSVYIWGNAQDLWRLWYVGGLKDSERLIFRNEIIWHQVTGVSWGKDGMSGLRMYAPMGERCLFFMLGEQGFNNNADNYWEGFEPIRKYLKAERDKVGWDNKIVADFFGFHPRMADHWFSKSQWSFPQKEQYERLQQESSNDAFKEDYDSLKEDYDSLKEDFYDTRAYFNNTHSNMTDVWSFDRVTGEERHGHATPKPVEMIERVIKSSSQKNVIEPFLGSGSTLIACEKTKRRCYGMELDPQYVDVIVQRYVDYTGNNNIRLNGEDIEWGDNE